MVHDLPAGCALCVQHWGLCTGLLVCRRVYPAAASSFSICSCLFQVIQSVGLGSSGRMNHWAECDAQTPTLPVAGSEIRGCPTAHRKFREVSRNSPGTICVPLVWAQLTLRFTNALQCWRLKVHPSAPPRNAEVRVNLRDLWTCMLIYIKLKMKNKKAPYFFQ